MTVELAPATKVLVEFVAAASFFPEDSVEYAAECDVKFLAGNVVQVFALVLASSLPRAMG